MKLMDEDDVLTGAEVTLPSCTQCRRRKLKCSRQQPLCSNCNRLGIECVYGSFRTKPGLKSGAVESLSRRLEAVESLVFGKEPIGFAEAAADQGHRPSQALSPIAGALTALSRQLQELNNNIQVTAHSPRGTDSNCLDRPRTSHSDVIHPLLSRKRVRHDSAPDDAYDNDPILNQVDKSPVNNNSLSTLPFNIPLQELLRIYFTHVQPWIAILHEKNFRTRLEDEILFPRLQIVLHAMCFAAVRFLHSSKTLVDNSEVERCMTKAKATVMLHALNGLTVENLQALVIVAFTEIGNGNTNMAWPLIGSLTRTVEYLQLTVETTDQVVRNGVLSGASALNKPDTWIEEEERRRVFWHIFLLDRFCSVTTGWNTSLTAADISRRLPVCGGRWYGDQPATAPYFGVWDGATARVSSTTPRPYRSHDKTSPDTRSTSCRSHAPSSGYAATNIIDNDSETSVVGAFAFFIESIESLSRVTASFLNQSIDFDDRRAVSVWLTRFKELDLRLVHWKTYLPQQWQDSGVTRPDYLGVMDPNMTIAHTTHNTSMILLHQRIGYPGPELSDIPLPSTYSAATCQKAASETANITRQYLRTTPREYPVSPQLAICALISAHLFLIDWRYYRTHDVATDFWSLIEHLDEMHLRWTGINREIRGNACRSLFSQFASRLRKLHTLHKEDPDYKITIMDGISMSFELGSDNPHVAHASSVPKNVSASIPLLNSKFSDGPHQRDRLTQSGRASADPKYAAQSTIVVPEQTAANSLDDDLLSISNRLMDQQFVNMDRIINFDDIAFNMYPQDGIIGVSGSGAMGILPGTESWPPIYWNQYETLPGNVGHKM